ncbi:MAG TPA: hypothetical protein VJ246_02015 [Patescibacteria group bacterium]|nr:hypothetical protein [Patescibacteria group bacterium]
MLTQELEKRGRIVFKVKKRDAPQAPEESQEFLIPLIGETREQADEEINAAALAHAKELSPIYWILAVDLFFETRPKTVSYLQYIGT